MDSFTVFAQLFLLLFARMLGFLLGFRVVASFLGMLGTVVVAVSLAMLFYPFILANIRYLAVSGSVVCLLACMEACVGLLLAIPFALALECLPLCAHLAELGRGALVGSQFSTELGTRESSLEGFAALAAALFAVSPSVYQLALELMKKSLATPGLALSFPSVALLQIDGEQYLQFLQFSGTVLRTVTCVVAPVFLFSFFLDVSLGVVSRCVPRMNTFFEFLPIRLLAGLGIALLSIPSVTQAVYPLLTKALLVSDL